VPKEINLSELELVTGCVRQDRTAQRQLFEKYQRAMFTTAYRLVNDYDHANDVLQEAFIDVFKNIKDFRGESTIGAWIKIIVVRKATQKYREEQKFETFDQKQHDNEVTEWHDNLTAEYLDQAIRSLSSGYRTIFTLIEIEGYSHKEAAELLKISEGTSKSQLFHSKKILKAKLKELYEAGSGKR
jgi:RNA polymerase sigma-70 factor (ECF subfamily)